MYQNRDHSVSTNKVDETAYVMEFYIPNTMIGGWEFVVKVNGRVISKRRTG